MSHLRPSTRLKGVIFALGGAIIFSTKAIFVKFAYQYEVSAVSLLLLRMGFALPVFLLGAIWWEKRKKLPPLSRRQWLGVALSGFLGYYLASIFDFIGLTYITASLERLVLFAYPTLVVLLSALFFKTPITRAQMGALLLTYLGLALVFWGQLEVSHAREVIIGVGWVLGAALTYAFYLIASGQLIPQLGVIRFTGYAMTASALGVLGQYLLSRPWLEVFQLEAAVYGWALALALVATVLAALLLAQGISLIGASDTAIINSIGPVSTISRAWIFRGDRLQPLQFVGAALVLLGVVVVSRKRR
jgi:drug/metabolite transporter (DMT)-like permease